MLWLFRISLSLSPPLGLPALGCELLSRQHCRSSLHLEHLATCPTRGGSPCTCAGCQDDHVVHKEAHRPVGSMTTYNDISLSVSAAGLPDSLPRWPSGTSSLPVPLAEQWPTPVPLALGCPAAGSEGRKPVPKIPLYFVTIPQTLAPKSPCYSRCC